MPCFEDGSPALADDDAGLADQTGPWHPHRASSAKHAGVQPAAVRVSAVAHGDVESDQCWLVGVVDPDVAAGIDLVLRGADADDPVDPAASAVSSSLEGGPERTEPDSPAQGGLRPWQSLLS